MHIQHCQTSKMECLTLLVVDYLQGSEHASGLLKLFCCDCKRDTQGLWYMPN